MFGVPPSRETSIARRVCAGDRAAESELVAAFSPEILSKVMARGVPFHLAKDLAQDVMIAVLVALREGRIRHPDRIGHYVQGTLRHVVSQHFRRLDRATELASDIAANELTPDERLGVRDELRVLCDALARLSSVDREILRLSVVEGWTSAAAARHLGLTPGQVRQRKSRAVRRLRTEVGR